MKYDYLIVGSGLSGAMFAHEASRRGFKCLVVDRRTHVGGNVRCENIEGINVHLYGPHIFHTNNKETWNYVNSIVPFEPFINTPLATIYGKMYNLPFNMNTFNQLWGVTNPKDAVIKLEEQKRKYLNPKEDNLETKALSMVGEDIYNLLIKGYTEKQWGCKCSDLPSSIITRLPLRFTFDNNYFKDLYQGIPVNGYNSLIDRLLDGSNVILGVDYNQSKAELKPVAKRLVYTGCIDEFFDFKYGRLEYRSLRFDHEVLKDISSFQGNAVVNYTDREVPFTRIVEHKHFYRKKTEVTVITREYPMKMSDCNEPFYPINNQSNMEVYRQYQELAKNDDTIFLGRLAEYKYFDMDDVIEHVLSFWNNEEMNESKLINN